MRTFLREPLLHFLLAAVLLFAAYSVWEGRRQADKRTIFVPEAELERLGAIYAAEAGSLPGPMEARGLVADYVRREALAREARRLGLDQHDLVVDRRLEQKMVFMVADLVDLPDPGDDTLKAWFDAYPGKFEIPARVTFDHVYFRDPDDPRIDAAPAELAMAAPDVWRTVGDPFMLQRQYGDLPLHEVARLFGVEFARTMDALEPSADWQGPVRSALGMHFVRLQTRSEPERPEFDAIRGAILADWTEEERRRLNEAAIQEIIDRYTVVIGGE